MRKNCFGLRERRNSQGAGMILLCFVTLAPLLGISGCTGMVNAQKPGAQSAVQVVPAAVNFGSSGVGKVVTQTATVANTGTTPITLTQASVSTTEFSISGLKFPVVIAAGQRAGFTVSFKGAKAGKINGVLNFHGDSWLSDPVELSGDVGNNSPQLNISSSNHNFGNVTVNTVASAALTVTNSGNADLKISNVSVTGATFATAGIKLPAVVAAGQNAVFEVTFSPKSAGSYMGTVSIASNDPNSLTTNVELKGAATTESVGKLTATPAVLSFSSVKVGSSVSGTTILRNAGNANITLSKVDVNAAGFTATGVAAPVLMVPGESLALTVRFSPNAAGTKSGTIALVNAQGGITSVSVSGTTAATPPSTPPPATSSLNVSPGSINFGNVVAGMANTQSVQISNSGTGSVSVTAANITGAGFSTTGLNLPLTLNAGQSSTFNVQFNPKSSGASAGNLAITSNASSTPHTIALAGTGVAAGMTLSVNPSSVSFGNVTVGNSATRTITVTNTGNSNVAISSASVSGSRLTLMGGSAVTLAPSQSIALTVQFAPTSAGAVNGSVSIASNASGSPAAVSVAGTGVTQAQHTVSLSWDASASASGYNVYRSLSSGAGYAKLTNGLDAALSYSDNTVQSGQTYFYVTTAVDSAGKESGYSTEVSANIP